MNTLGINIYSWHKVINTIIALIDKLKNTGIKIIDIIFLLVYLPLLYFVFIPIILIWFSIKSVVTSIRLKKEMKRFSYSYFAEEHQKAKKIIELKPGLYQLLKKFPLLSVLPAYWFLKLMYIHLHKFDRELTTKKQNELDIEKSLTSAFQELNEGKSRPVEQLFNELEYEMAD